MLLKDSLPARSSFKLRWADALNPLLRCASICIWFALFCPKAVALPTASTALPSYFTRVWRTEEGLPQNSVTSLAQTRDGYLWQGTYGGLARFDGDTFTVFDADKGDTPEMRNSRIVSLFEDPQGTLWIGHETGELTRYENGMFHAVSFRVPWENTRILAIASDQSGKLWLLNEEGRLASTTGDTLSVPNAGTATKVAALARNAQGQIWVAYAGDVLALTNNRLVSLSTTGESLGGYVTGICASRDDGLWLFSGGRIRKWNGQKLVEDLGPCPWDQASIGLAIETSSGCLAVGTVDQGLYLIFPRRGVLHFDRANGFPHDWIRSLKEDREGTLWVGLGGGGLVALRAGNVKTLNPPDLWRDRVLLSVTAAQDGAIWIGTEGAGLYRFLDEQWTHFGESDGLSNLFVWSVAEDSQQRLWVGTWGGGLLIRDGEKFRNAPGLADVGAPMPAMFHARPGLTWVGTGAGLLRYEDGKSTWFGRKEGLNLPDIRAVVDDRDGGGVWFGMQAGGLGRIHHGVLQQFHKAEGLSSEYVQCLHRETDGTLWIGTYGGGLNRFKNGQFAAISTSQGLPSSFICDVEEDDHGNFWFSSRGGIFRISKEELNRCADGQIKTVNSLTYGKGDGMPTLECSGGFQPAGCKTADGRLWFPTSKGLVVVDPNEAKANQVQPPVVIEKILVDGQAIPRGAPSYTPFQVRPGRQRFEFRYTALSFIAPEKMRFQYRLEGLDPEWTEAGSKRAVNYSYIPPGNYNFHVIACNSDGIWNKAGATFAFVVQPHFWQQWWFRILAGLAAAVVLGETIWLIFRRRMRLKLERLERQRAIERERSRIAQDIHDNLGASLTRISLLSQSAWTELDNPPLAATQLDRIYQTSRELTRAMDEIVWAVNPQHDTLDSLASYLGKFAQDFLGPLHIRCRLDVPVHLPPWPVTAEVRHNLFLAFKEALHNVVKHAGASEVLISLTTEIDGFTLSIRDNGRGCSPAAPIQPTPDNSRIAHGNGLVNMQQRLRKVDGRFSIHSSPGNGTEVKFVVPVVISAS